MLICKVAYSEAPIIKETYTGTSLDRKECGKLMKAAKVGDALVLAM